MKKRGFLWLTGAVIACGLTTGHGIGISFRPNVDNSTPTASAHKENSQQSYCLVNVPVMDLRRAPRSIDGTAALKRPYDLDMFQETQLLYGERVKIREERLGWVRVEAVEQAEFSHNQKWEGYPGWMKKKDLIVAPAQHQPNAVVVSKYAKVYDAPSRKGKFMEIPLGVRINISFQKKPWARMKRPGMTDGWVRIRDVRMFKDLPKKENDIRASVVKAAGLFVKEPYYWGGRAGHRPDWPDRPSGVDCSGLVNLAYRVSGIDVPRDSVEQFMKSRPISSYQELKIGDLIFLSEKSSPNKIMHVMIYIGGDRVIEAVSEFDVVRRVSLRHKLGKPLNDISPLEPAGDYFVYFGRLIP